MQKREIRPGDLVLLAGALRFSMRYARIALNIAAETLDELARFGGADELAGEGDVPKLGTPGCATRRRSRAQR
jgi:hypothetical protein